MDQDNIKATIYAEIDRAVYQALYAKCVTVVQSENETLVLFADQKLDLELE